MSTPTPEDIASWPAPNYVNPSTRVNMVVGIEIVFLVVTVSVVIARMISPIFTNRTLGVEDFVMAFAMVMTAGVGIINCTSVSTGFGYHIWDFKPEWTAPVGKVAITEQVLFGPIVAATKISILLFYRRIFPSQTFARLVWGGIIFLILYAITSFFGELFQCVPIYSYWDEQPPGRKCISESALLISLAVINTLSDIYTFVLPMPWLARLQMPRKQRFGIIVLFGLGLIVCVAGIIRIWYITYYFKHYDFSYNGAVLSVLVVVECNVGIICGSLPSVRQLMAKLFPKLLDTSQDQTGTSAVPDSQSFPFQNLGGKKQGFETSVLGGNHGNNTSQESMLREDETQINRRDEVTIGYC